MKNRLFCVEFRVENHSTRVEKVTHTEKIIHGPKIEKASKHSI